MSQDTELVALLNGNSLIFADTPENEEALKTAIIKDGRLEGPGVMAINVIGYYRRNRVVTVDANKFNKYLDKTVTDLSEGDEWKE